MRKIIAATIALILLTSPIYPITDSTDADLDGLLQDLDTITPPAPTTSTSTIFDPEPDLEEESSLDDELDSLLKILDTITPPPHTDAPSKEPKPIEVLEGIFRELDAASPTTSSGPTHSEFTNFKLDELHKAFIHTIAPAEYNPILLKELHQYGISAKEFIRRIAQRKRERALFVFQVSNASDYETMTDIESELTAHPIDKAPITYQCSDACKKELPQLQEAIKRNEALLQGSCTVLYGIDTSTKTVARPQDDGTYRHELHLPASFTQLSPSEQDAILGHEFAHMNERHIERLFELQPLNLETFGLEHGISVYHAAPLFASGALSIDDASSSSELQLIKRTQELEADFLALLNSDNPRRIQEGMETYLSHHEPTDLVGHPSPAKRILWARRIANLLELEQSLAAASDPS